VATPKYLEALRQVTREAQTREIRETSEQRGEREGVISPISLISPLRAPQSSPFGRTFTVLESRRPDHVPVERWQQCVEDGRRFLAKWGEQAEALGWDSRDLFGLHTPPAKPHPSYSRLSRYDETGLIWLLDGRDVMALTKATASIRSATGAITTYRRFDKPALGPLGDSLDDLK
jgi:hypothetical protein